MIKAVANKSPLFYSAFIICVVLAAYFNVVNTTFISWDDADFTINNNDVKDFNIKAFFTNFYLGNYSPLTMVSFSMDYYFGKEHSWFYHLHNIILHAINALLVFFLFNKLQNNKYLALFTALIFALHPLQVESVSWVSERKNVLCGLFYILSLILYLKYVQIPNIKNYFIVFVAFLCALFSKGMAVSVPISFLAVDLWLNRSFNKKVLIEKIPFFVLSFIFGIIAIKAQSSANFLKLEEDFSWIQKLYFSGYSFMLYVVHFFAPIHLSAIYPYPKSGFNFLYLVGLAFFIFSIFLLYRSIKKQQNILAGGILFFIGNIIFVLQFIAIGAVLMADHYTYIASLGIIFPSLVFLFSFSKRQNIVIKFCLLISVILLFSTHFRNNVWKNGINFWSDIVKKYPNSHIALSSLGSEYSLIGDTTKAINYLNKSVNLNPNYSKGFYNRGLLYAKTNHFNEAIRDFTKAIELKNYTKAYISRAGIYYQIKDYSKALADIEVVLNLEPNNIKANYISANCYDELSQLDKALFFYNKIIALNPKEETFYLRRAIVYGKQQKFSNCLEDLAICNEINPNFAEAYYWKAVAKVNLNQNPCNDLQTAINLGFEAAKGPQAKYCK